MWVSDPHFNGGSALSRKITLNSFLIFEPDKKRITGRGSPAVISASASLCLELLIEHVGQLVTHQQFYDHVWRRFGAEPASTTLYQNISALRRAFYKAGLQEDIIRTMPRKGFLLSPQTTVSRDSGSASADATGEADEMHAVSPVEKHETFAGEKTVNEKTPAEERKVIHSTGEHFSHSFFLKVRQYGAGLSFKKLMMVSLSVVLLSVIYFFFTLTGRNEEKPLFSYSTDYRGCTLFSNTDAMLNTESVLKTAEKLKLDCTTAPYVYLTAYKNADRLSYFSCQHPLNARVRANCRSFYYVKNFNDE